MKNFKKVLAVMTAAASLCMSATAFAATEGTVLPVDESKLAGTYDLENSVLNITNGNEVLENSETTILVLSAEFTADELTNTDSTSELAKSATDKIMYINQQNTTTDGKNFTGMGLKLPAGAEKLGVGEYPIKVGYYDKTSGEFGIKIATLKVAEAGSGEKSFTIQWGEVNGDGVATSADATAILVANAGKEITFTDKNGVSHTWADKDNLAKITYQEYNE